MKLLASIRKRETFFTWDLPLNQSKAYAKVFGWILFSA